MSDKLIKAGQLDGYESSERIYDPDGASPTINTCGGGGHEPKIRRLRIRKLTPSECMRLMGFEKRDTEAMGKAGLSNNTVYHSAGDSIVTTCLVALIGQLTDRDYKAIIKDYADKLSKEE